MATYADRALTVPNSNPVVLDAGGRATIFLSAAAYRFVLTDANSNQIWDQDDVVAFEGVGSSSGLDVAITAGQDLAINDLCYISDGSGGLVAGRAYKADAALAYASIDAVLGFATTAILSGDAGFQRRAGSLDGFTGLVAGSTYYASTVVGTITATPPTNARSVGVAISATTIIIENSPRRPSVISPLVCQGRLTLETGVPISVTDQTAKVTLYFCPHGGNRVDVFDGTRWNRRTFTELSIALPAVANQVYDVFLVDTAGVLSLELLAWTNDTTRATALVKQDGAYVKTGALTRRYLGSYRTTAVAGQTEDSLVKRLVSNHYNRVERPLRRTETTANWTYNTNNVYRQANAAVANQVEFVIGVEEDPVHVDLSVAVADTVATTYVAIALALDSTSAPANDSTRTVAQVGVVNTLVNLRATFHKFTGVGRHFVAWLEDSNGSASGGTTTWYSNGGNALGGAWSGMSGWVKG